jgi:hypothetical protein
MRVALSASLLRPDGKAARCVPVRARPQIGFSFGKTAVIGRTVKP